MWTKILIFFMVITGMFWVSLNIPKSTKTEEVCRGCNILMIDIDILRADELPCYGYSRMTAPNICQLAEKSLVFYDNYSTSYWTLPSIVSTVTSLYPTFHRVKGIYDSQNHLDLNKVTLAKTLQKAGYRTIFMGQDGDPAILTEKNGGLEGYEEVINDKSVEEVINDLKNSDRPWFLHYYQSKLHMPYLIGDNEKPIEEIEPPKGLPLTNKQFNEALGKHLRQNYKNIFRPETIKDKSLNFDWYLKSNDRLVELFYKLYYSDKQEYYLLDGWKPFYDTYINSIDIKNPADVDYIRMMYDTKLFQSDQEIGSIFKFVENEISDNLITVVTSDHGETFGERGKFSHEGDFYSGLYQTPLIIHSPKIGAKRIDQSSSNIDIFPTLMDMVGLDIPKGLQGKSWLDPNTSNTSKDTFAFSEFEQGQILQNKKWLYFLPSLVNTPQKSQLYFKQNDPYQLINVADKYPELVKELYGQLNIIRSYDTLLSNQPVPTTFSEIKLSPEKIERLKKEGYF